MKKLGLVISLCVLSQVMQASWSVVCSPSDGGRYKNSLYQYFIAIPYDGYTFDKWVVEINNKISRTSTNDSLPVSDYAYQFFYPEYNTGTTLKFTAYFTKTQCTIKTLAQNGTVTGGGIYQYNTSVTLKATPNVHYHFVKWSDGNTNNPRTITVTKDTTFTAVFAIDQFTITATGEHGSVTGSGTYNYGATATMTATGSNCYSFQKWSDGNTKNPRSVVVTQDSVFTAIFDINTYTITFNPNGGSVSPTSKSVSCGSTYGDLPTPTMTGYTFAGWFTSATGGTKVASTTTVSITSNQTLFAHWTAISSTVTLDQQSGTGGTTSVSATYGSAMPSITLPTWTGYTFGGYYTAVNGGGTQYYTATGASAKNWDKTSATTLYAKWTANTYTITFDPNGGSVSPTSKSVTCGSTFGELPTPSYPGYKFDGWYTSATGGTQITSDSMVSITSDQTLFAHWSLGQYTLMVKAEDATMGSATGSGIYAYNTDVTITATANDNYHFVHWNDGDTITSREITITQDAMFVASFAPNCAEYANWPVVALYDWLMMLNITEINKMGYDIDKEDVSWYRIVGEVDTLSGSFPQDDQLVGIGHYFTLDQNLNNTGDYYAVADVSSNNGKLCTGLMRTKIIRYSGNRKAQRLSLAPTIIPTNGATRIMGLIPEETADIFLYTISGQLLGNYHSAGESNFNLVVPPMVGSYQVRVVSTTFNQTLRFIVTNP